MNPVMLAALALLAGAAFWKREEIADVIGVAKPTTFWDEEFKRAGIRYGVKWQWLKAIAQNESSLGRHPSVARGLAEPQNIEDSKSEDGKSWGLMQITLPDSRVRDHWSTWSDDLKRRALGLKASRLNDPLFSIDLAAKIVSVAQTKFPLVDPRYNEWVVKSYNQGVRNSQRERSGEISGYAGEYYKRFLRNLNLVDEGRI
jgi:hypothetical protein